MLVSGSEIQFSDQVMFEGRSGIHAAPPLLVFAFWASHCTCCPTIVGVQYVAFLEFFVAGSAGGSPSARPNLGVQKKG
jgi:hypothetical protein